MKISKKTFVRLSCGIIIVSLLFVSFMIYQKVYKGSWTYISKQVTKNKESFVDSLTNHQEVLRYLEDIYLSKDKFMVSYSDGKLDFYKEGIETFNTEERERLETMFKEWNWSSVDLYKQKNRKILKVILPQVKINSNTFYTYYISYAPDGGTDLGEEIFHNWFYNGLIES